MNRFLKGILYFMPLMVFAYVLLVLFWGALSPDRYRKNLNDNRGGYGHFYSRLKEVKTIESVDVLLLGSSHAYRGFDPRVFQKHDIKLFNLGSSAQTPLQQVVILERYLDQTKPKLVIFEVYPVSFCSDGVEASIDLLSNDPIDFHVLKLILNQNHIKLYNLLIFNTFRNIFCSANQFEEPYHKPHFKDTYIAGGYVMKELKYARLRDHNSQKWNYKQVQFSAFEKALKMLDERNIKYILVQSPVSKSLFDSYTNFGEFDSLMTNYRPGGYFNFNYLMNLNDSLNFYDPNHLNQHGVELFNERLIEVLTEEGHFPIQ